MKSKVDFHKIKSNSPLAKTVSQDTCQTKPDMIAAIVVAYNPDIQELKLLLQTISPQVEYIFLIGNSHLTPKEYSVSDCTQLRIHQNTENIGLAAAQNQGLTFCDALKVSHVLFLDQDSKPSKDLVVRLLEAESRLTASGIPIGGVAPLLIDSKRGRAWPYMRNRWKGMRENIIPDEQGACRADFLFSSGSLIKTILFREVGNFMEYLFIDHIDLEWCYRAGARGYKFYGIPSIHMHHNVGDGFFFLFGRMHPKHNPERNYFVFRNSIILLSLPHIPLNWKINEIARIIPRAVFYAAISSNPKKHLLSNFRGITEGIRLLLSQNREK